MAPVGKPDAPPPRGKRYTTAKRRAKILEVVQTHGTLKPTEIRRIIEAEHNVSVARNSIHKDIQMLEKSDSDWSLAMTRLAWPVKIRQMYSDTNEEISDLRKLRRELLDVDREPDPIIVELISNYEGDPKERQSIIDRLRRVYGAAVASRVAGKIAYVDSIITEKRNFLITMMTDVPLYERGQRLAEYYESHKETA